MAYVAAIEGMPDEEMTALAEESLTVFRRRDDGAYSIPLLRRRAENDLEAVQKILRSYGYYNGSAEVVVDEISQERYDELDEFEFGLPSVSSLAFWRDRPEEPDPDRWAYVVITVDPGTQFTLERHDFDFVDPEMNAVVPSPQALGSPVGGPALAIPILGAEGAAIDLLQNIGFPYAEGLGRDAVADLALATLEVESQLRSGPAAVFGPIAFEGLDEVQESYLRTYVPWQQGEVVDRKLLRRFQESLLATDLFDTLLVQIPPDPPPGEGPVPLPILVTADERPFRTIGLGGGFATDTGPYVTAEFQHRNLWGENETLSFNVDVGTDEQSGLLAYREPQFLRPGQDLLAGLELARDDNDAFRDKRVTLTGGLQRRLTPHWVVGYGLSFQASQIEQNNLDTEALIGGVPTFAEYDSTDSLLNPTRGLRARFDVAPYAGTLEQDFTKFLTLDSRGSTYWDVLDNDIYILAGRARLGSIIADSLDDVPGNQRLYAGGGGSVRGYALYTVGPIGAGGDPTGGRSVAEASIELRTRLWQDIGGVVFVDAGSVSQEMFPDFEDGAQVGVGFGVRYFSPAGPIRLDIAFPLDRRPIDDAWQLYFSIGQAF